MIHGDAELEIGVGADEIINIKIAGDLIADSISKFAEWTLKVKQVIQEQFQKTNKGVLCLVDISDLKRYDPQVMVQLASLLKDNEPYVMRTATFGGNSYMIMAQDVVIALSGRKNLKAFRTKEEAANWLQNIGEDK